MKRIFGILILTLVISFATMTSCNQAPAVSDTADSISISAQVDTILLDVDTTAVDTSLLK